MATVAPGRASRRRPGAVTVGYCGRGRPTRRRSQVSLVRLPNSLDARAADPTNGRYTLATLTDEGMANVVATAPGHVREVRRIVIDPLTTTQQRRLLEICRRILGAIDPGASAPMDRLEQLRTVIG